MHPSGRISCLTEKIPGMSSMTLLCHVGAPHGPQTITVRTTVARMNPAKRGHHCHVGGRRDGG